MQYIKDVIVSWAGMKFSENPYGKAIPSKYLYDDRILRRYDRLGNPLPRKTLADLMQDGYAVASVCNTAKDAPWEKEETISFSRVFHELVENGTMCPSNYVASVITALQQYDIENQTYHNHEFYRGTITRALRCLASYVREQCLQEIIDEAMTSITKTSRAGYRLYGATVEDDMQRKTDLILFYNSSTYRIWSYQTTRNGIEKTSSRVLRANGRGYNILMPFNIDERVDSHGWYLYDASIVKKAFSELISMRDIEIPSHFDFSKSVRNNPEIISEPAIFRVN